MNSLKSRAKTKALIFKNSLINYKAPLKTSRTDPFSAQVQVLLGDTPIPTLFNLEDYDNGEQLLCEIHDYERIFGDHSFKPISFKVVTSSHNFLKALIDQTELCDNIFEFKHLSCDDLRLINAFVLSDLKRRDLTNPPSQLLKQACDHLLMVTTKPYEFGKRYAQDHQLLTDQQDALLPFIDFAEFADSLVKSGKVTVFYDYLDHYYFK